MKLIDRYHLIPIMLVIIVGVLQHSNVLAVAGVRPNMILVVLVSLAFFIREFLYFGLLIGLSVLMSQFFLDTITVPLTLALIGIGVYLLSPRLPGQPWVNNVVLIALGTFLFYLVVDIEFARRDLDVLLLETLYNSIGGMVTLVVLRKFLAYEKTF